jgi:hypothetical protein
MARDINALIKAEEITARAAAEKIFGDLVSFQEITTIAQDLFPREVQELQALGIFYESEMIRCRDAKAYFSGCLAAAAMIESCLLLFSFLDTSNVARTAFFNKVSKPNKKYEEIAVRWTLKELIPIADELGWIRHSVQPEAIKVLVPLHTDLAPIVRPGITAQEIVGQVRYIETHADLALLHLMQSMRNLVHGGRCIRLRKKLDTQDFSEWAQLVIVLTGEIRDCLILKLKPISQQYLSNLLNSADGQIAAMKLARSIFARAAANAASQGQN